MKDYLNLTDEALAALAKENDENAYSVIFERYKKTVRDKAGLYFIQGGDNEDLVQEGMIGLFRSVLDFDESKNVKFSYFAQLCIERQIQTAIKKAASKKNSPLNTSVNILDVSILDEDGKKLSVMVDGPEEIIVGEENAMLMEKCLRQELSRFENMVFDEMLQGKNYAEIATEMNKEKKSIDNAIQRIKRKMKKITDTRICLQIKNQGKI